MKTNHLQRRLTVIAAIISVWSGTTAQAQDSSATNAMPPAAPAASAPHLTYGVPQILKLAQADVGDDTIIAYIKNSGNSYGLNAEQILYLRQQGVSDPVITTMLNQPKPGMIANTTMPPTTGNDDLVAAAGAEPATVVNTETVAAVTAEPVAAANDVQMADANAEPAFTVYSDPLAAGGTGPTVTVIYYQNVPTSMGGYQPHDAPNFNGYPMVAPAVGFGGRWSAGWSGGFQSARRIHRDWHR
jgi:hypothetical protein